MITLCPSSSASTGTPLGPPLCPLRPRALLFFFFSFQASTPFFLISILPQPRCKNCAHGREAHSAAALGAAPAAGAAETKSDEPYRRQSVADRIAGLQQSPSAPSGPARRDPPAARRQSIADRISGLQGSGGAVSREDADAKPAPPVAKRGSIAEKMAALQRKAEGAACAGCGKTNCVCSDSDSDESESEPAPVVPPASASEPAPAAETGSEDTGGFQTFTFGGDSAEQSEDTGGFQTFTFDGESDKAPAAAAPVEECPGCGKTPETCVCSEDSDKESAAEADAEGQGMVLSSAIASCWVPPV